MLKIMNFLKKQLAIQRIVFSNVLQYRYVMFFWIGIHIITFLTIYYLWQSIFTDTALSIPFTLPEIVTYYVIAGLIHQITTSYFEYEMSRDVRMGTLNNFLLKPFSYVGLNILRNFGWHSLQGIIGVFLYVIVVLSLDAEIVVHTDPNSIILMLIMILLAGVFYIGISFLLGTFALWFIDAESFYNLKDMFVLLLSGFFVPINLFPESAQALFSWLPFQYTIYFPIQIYLGNVENAEIIKGIAVLAIWTVILWIGSIALWKKGLTRYEGVGI